MTAPKYGIDQLREAVRLFSHCRESFNQLFTPTELMLLYAAYKRSEWDIAPDRWTEAEVSQALAGLGSGATSERR